MQGDELTQEEAATFALAWWLLALIGVLSVVAGAILVVKPGHSLATLAVVIGIFVLVDSVVELVGSFGRDVENRGLTAILGILGLVVGIILVRHPTHAVSAIGLLVGIWLVAAGAIRLVRVLAFGRRIVWWATIALLEIAVGIVVVADPRIGYTTLAVITGLWLIVNGFATITVAVAMRMGMPELRPDTSEATQSFG